MYAYFGDGIANSHKLQFLPHLLENDRFAVGRDGNDNAHGHILELVG